MKRVEQTVPQMVALKVEYSVGHWAAESEKSSAEKTADAKAGMKAVQTAQMKAVKKVARTAAHWVAPMAAHSGQR